MSLQTASSVAPVVAIVGTGFYGLQAARTYLKINPSARITLFSFDATVGGVWSDERLYPNLYAQITSGLFEWSSLRMSKEGEINGGYISGKTINKYFKDFVAQEGLEDLIRLNTMVEHVEKTPDGWILSIRNLITNLKEKFKCNKLIVANGPTSRPHVPEFPKYAFTPPISHSSKLGKIVPELTACKRVVVVGAAKSAYDAVYLLMSRGVGVDWIIRDNGAGPLSIFPARIFGYLTMRIPTSRWFAVFSPSVMATGWIQWYLHETAPGRLVSAAVWKVLGAYVEWFNGYDKSGNAQKLRPNPNGVYWANGGLGCMSVPDFWSLFHDSNLVKVYRDEISHLADKSVHLKKGDTIPTEHLVLCTGWEDSIPMFSPHVAREIGLPSAFDEDDEAWTRQEKEAEKRILERFPELVNPPPHARPPRQRGWKHYRRIVSPKLAAKGDNSLAFLGQIHTVTTAHLSEVQSLWAVAFLEGRIQLPSESEMNEEVLNWNAWSKRRYLWQGRKVPYAIYDALTYMDTLLGDLGVATFRKSNFIKEWFWPYDSRDHATIIEEFKSQKPIRRSSNVAVRVSSFSVLVSAQWLFTVTVACLLVVVVAASS